LCKILILIVVLSPRGVFVEVHTLLVADYANVTERGTANVMGIFRDIYGPKFPLRHSEMHLVVGLSADPSEYEQKRRLTIKLLNADATEELVNFSHEFTVPKGSAGRRAEINHIFRLRDIVFPTPGPYGFSVLVDNDHKGSLDIELVELGKS